MNEVSGFLARRQFEVALGSAVVLVASFAVLLVSPLPLQTRQAISGVGLVTGGLLVILGALAVVRRGAGARRTAWLLLLAAAVSAVAGNLWGLAVGADPVTNPSIVTEGSLALAYALSIAGMLNFPAVRRRGGDLVLMVLDGLVLGGAVLVLASVTLYPGMLEPTAGSTLTRASNLLLSLLAVVTVTVALLLLTQSRSDRVFLGLVGSAFLLYAVSDLVFAGQAARGAFEFGGLHDLGWIAGYLLLAAATCHVDAVGRVERRDGDPSVVPRTLVVFAVLLTALMVQLFDEEVSLSLTQIVLWLVLIVAVGIRQTFLTADNAALRAGLERRVREQTSDLRRMARETEVLLRSVGDGIYGVDPEGRITFVNPSGARALGLTVEELQGRHAHDLFHAPRGDGEPFPVEECYVTQAIQSGATSNVEEDTYLRADGSTFPVEITASPLIDEDTVRGAVVVFRDVTQRHEVDRMKNEFLSVVSHELRTPLTSIRGSLGLLASGSLVQLTPHAERMLSIAVESSDRLTRLINDILDIERIESGRLPMDLAPQYAADLVRHAATELEGLAHSHDTRIVLGPVPGRVMADADRVVQALMNLIGNAVKFSPSGGTVNVETEVSGTAVTFSVSDQGRGIPEEHLTSIFQPFEQVDSSDARQKGGTGLGLAISRGIVEGHGGRIWAESRLGVGTTIRFTIPRVRIERYLDVAGAPDAPAVLVCDDDPGIVASFSAILSSQGYRPIGVTSGAEAVRRAQTDRPAAVLVDMVMEGTSGAEVVAELKRTEQTREIPVVVVSGSRPASEPLVANASDDWLVKPVSEEQLLATVASAVEGRRRDAEVLIVEDDASLAGVLMALLGSHGLAVHHVASVEQAIERGREVRPAVIVLDLQLPDGDGSQVIASLRREGLLDETSVVVYSADDVLLEQRSELQLGDTVFLTKSRAAPEELEDRVLRLVDAVTGKGRGSRRKDKKAPDRGIGSISMGDRNDRSTSNVRQD